MEIEIVKEVSQPSSHAKLKAVLKPPQSKRCASVHLLKPCVALGLCVLQHGLGPWLLLPLRLSLLQLSNFTILSGDDSLTLPFMAVGAQGVVSVASNVIPREVAHMVKAFATGKVEVALKLHDKFYPLFKDLFIESNPGPVKAALAMMGMMEDEFRLPLVPIGAASREKLRKTLKACGVLK